MATQPFRIDVPQAVLDDLQTRLARTRWPDEIPGAGWDYGTNLGYLRELAAYWHTGFDWRAQETKLNAFRQFRTEIDGQRVHFLHEPGRGPRPLPLVLVHGWPDSFYRFYKLIPLLTDPASHGGRAEDAFDVVVPSLPGYGFSGRPAERGWGPGRMADLVHTLLTRELGYARYGAHGGDWGSYLTEQLALQHPADLVGLHLTDVPFRRFTNPLPGNSSPAEQAFRQQVQAWQRQEGAYAQIQGTKPQTLAYGLADSPVGLLGWLVEKFRTWSDCGGEVERRFSKDELLTNALIYWATETINSANRLYYETQHTPPPAAPVPRVEVPTGFALFPRDLLPVPREVGERFYNVQRWTELPRGGHFAALEEPELLAEELRAFFRPLHPA